MTEVVGGNAAVMLRSYIERVERLEEEKSALTVDIRGVYNEAKADGFDAKVLREIVKIRKMDPQERSERQQMLAMYLEAIGTGELYEGGETTP